MATYKTPGVYVEEIPTLPPSVAEVSTAIPAFIGCTANGPAPDDDGHVIPIVKRISTLLEFKNFFGEPNPSSFTIASGNDPIKDSDVTRDESGFDYMLYYCLSLYFNNGGGSCYIVSVGNFDTVPVQQHFVDGLSALEKEDEPTLILLTEAVNLKDGYYSLCEQARAQCQKLGDRFVILDVLNSDDGVSEFRKKTGDKDLEYGAAYYPYIQTALTYAYDENNVTLGSTDGAGAVFSKSSGENEIIVQYTGASKDAPKMEIVVGSDTDPITFSISTSHVLTINTVSEKTGKDVADAWNTWKADTNNDPQGFDISADNAGSANVTGSTDPNIPLDLQDTTTTLADIKSTNTALYNQVKSILSQQRITLPPSSAIAGIYASVDRERGVWKAPANVGLSSVIGPVKKITNDEQDGLNVDPESGKSINAIRSFTGKGTLVWGARTLAGNDNEWRYVSVRRLFNMIEESAQKSTAFAVFEPNDATTWLKVKAMIESYLYGLWQQGALAGPTPDAAYFVNVGLGKSMTPQDVLEGRMIVAIGIAAVRPAEFIILRFSHQMQQA